MGNTDRRGPEISDGWQGTSDDGSGADMSTAGGALRVAVIGAGVAGLGEGGVLQFSRWLFFILTIRLVSFIPRTKSSPVRCHKPGGTHRA